MRTSTRARSGVTTRPRSGWRRSLRRRRRPARSSRTRTPARRWRGSSPGSTSASCCSGRGAKEWTRKMANILIYALHYEGAINKNSLGAVSEGARLAGELGGEAHVIMLGEGVPRELAASLGAYGASRVLVAEGPEGLAQPVAFELSAHAGQATMLVRGEQRGADVDIEGADILIAGGRGLGKPEGFALVEELAQAFGGTSAVAATRAVVDAGWYPYAAQIGQTGKTVAPKLYLAAGISGAIQHKVGMQSSENIVAINKDANAPIFEFSDLGIVGDLNKILPRLTEAVKARKGG